MLFNSLSIVDRSGKCSATHVFVSFSDHDSVVFAKGFSCSPFSGGQITERESFLVAETVASVMTLKIIQAIFHLGIILRRRPLSTYVEAGDVCNPWLFLGGL